MTQIAGIIPVITSVMQAASAIGATAATTIARSATAIATVTATSARAAATVTV